MLSSYQLLLCVLMLVVLIENITAVLMIMSIDWLMPVWVQLKIQFLLLDTGARGAASRVGQKSLLLWEQILYSGIATDKLAVSSTEVAVTSSYFFYPRPGWDDLAWLNTKTVGLYPPTVTPVCTNPRFYVCVLMCASPLPISQTTAFSISHKRHNIYHRILFDYLVLPSRGEGHWTCRMLRR